jgi:hypothetical protein
MHDQAVADVLRHAQAKNALDLPAFEDGLQLLDSNLLKLPNLIRATQISQRAGSARK